MKQKDNNKMLSKKNTVLFSLLLAVLWGIMTFTAIQIHNYKFGDIDLWVDIVAITVCVLPILYIWRKSRSQGEENN